MDHSSQFIFLQTNVLVKTTSTTKSKKYAHHR